MSHSLHPRAFLKSRHGIIEVAFRGITTILSLAASATSIATIYHSSSSIKDGFRFYSTSHHAAAWVLFLSLFWVFFQVLAVLQLCSPMKFLLISIPAIRLRAILPAFFIIDVGVTALGTIGYFAGGISLAVYAYHWKVGYMPPMYAGMPHMSLDYIKQCIVPLVTVTAGLSFLLLFLCIGMLFYFPVGRLCLKWPTHGVSYSPNMDIPEDHVTLTASPKHNDDDKNHAYAYASACAPEKTVISYITY